MTYYVSRKSKINIILYVMQKERANRNFLCVKKERWVNAKNAERSALHMLVKIKVFE